MRVNGIPYRTVWLEGSTVHLIDQRRLPARFEILELPTVQQTAEAIRTMTVRGAGAIGVAAGFAMAQAALLAPASGVREALEQAAAIIRATRPTAQNLFYAVQRIVDGTRSAHSVDEIRRRAVVIAQRMADEDAASGERIGIVGASLIRDGASVMTHCNAGWLAFADWGTALAPIYVAHRAGKRVSVIVNETRPRGQGAKLTAWELGQEGVSHTLIPDTAAGYAMAQKLVDLIIVGADRIAANGDVANKIGTYALAVLAQAHQIPFYVAAPTTTIDAACPEGSKIPIEERSADEVVWTSGVTDDGAETRVRTAPEHTPARNWAFDVTPAALIRGLITDRGMIRPEPQAIAEVMTAAATR
ncbi:MAG: S-methyl-5-thioribose-1-phosphate isomerase [Candidatus Omnitrophica bacterium]|nr:S-methyl-5-thioribose-1-phosphate isomerase [Candidatus Omnitrophota bacterium]